MAKERLKSPRARLFMALDLPDALRDGLVGWAGEALADPALRPLAPESLHVTLVFLGYRPEKQVGELSALLEGISQPAPEVRLGDPVGRPSGSRPRLFALPIESPGLVSLQAELEERLVSAGLYEPEKRPYWPHLTVARVRPEGRGSKRPQRVSEPPGGLPEALAQPANCRRVALYRSELKPQGARYVPLAQVELSRSGQQ
jgi:2'-5' RNA ligase